MTQRRGFAFQTPGATMLPILTWEFPSDWAGVKHRAFPLPEIQLCWCVGSCPGTRAAFAGFTPFPCLPFLASEAEPAHARPRSSRSLGSSSLAVGTGRLLRVRAAPPLSPLSGLGTGGTEPGQGGRQGPAHPAAQPMRVRGAGLAGAGHSTPSPVEEKEQKQGTETCRLLCNNLPRS